MASQAFHNFRAGLPPPAESLAILVGVVQVSVLGLAGLANPVEFANGYGLPMTPATAAQQHPGAVQPSTSETEQARKIHRTQSAYITAVAARNIQNGVTLLALACYLRDRRALGVAVAAGFVTTLADTLIVKWHGIKDGIWGHAFGMLGSLAIGSSLLYWGQENK